MYKGPSASPMGQLNEPSLDDGPDVKLESLGHGVEEDRLVFRNYTEMQGSLDFNT